jgi:tripartite-type tricarboxylate transporter receptor subunit TctC
MQPSLGRLARFALCCLALCTAATAAAQGYPAKPVRILLGFAAGGSIDIVTRVLADGLSKSTGEAFVVENRPGAGGNLAVDALLKAPPDGYTILMGATGIAANPALFKKVPYQIDDLAAISLVGDAPVLIMANPSLPADSIAELIKLAKAKPGTIRSAIVNGTTAHLASDMFRMMAGVDIPHVPYKVNSQAFQDVMGGQVEVVVLPIAESLPHVKAKRVKALAQTGRKRSFLAPDIPTVDEAGLKGYAITAWYLALGPAKMPRETVAVLAREINKVLKQPEVAARLNASGVDVIGTTPEEATAFLKSESEKLAKLIRWSGARIE